MTAERLSTGEPVFVEELLRDGGKDDKDAGWVSWDHPVRGFLFPAAAGGSARPDQVQEDAIDGVIEFPGRYMKPR
jgi:hypothetical protein